MLLRNLSCLTFNKSELEKYIAFKQLYRKVLFDQLPKKSRRLPKITRRILRMTRRHLKVLEVVRQLTNIPKVFGPELPKRFVTNRQGFMVLRFPSLPFHNQNPLVK